MITPEDIDDALEETQEHRPINSISASMWDQCDRRLWLTLRNVSPVAHKGKTLRTFDIGHALEDAIVRWVERTQKAKVVNREKPLLNRYGTSLGHIDGMLWFEDSTFWLLEMKTANHRRFQEWLKKGVPDKYFAQTQLYMAHSAQLSAKGNQLTKCLFVVVDKDTSEIHTEEVEYDRVYAQLQRERIEELIVTDSLPHKTEDWQCRFCPQKGVCLDKESAQMDCRTCANVSVNEKGEFICPFGTELCDNYVQHPQLVELMGYEMQGVDHETLTVDYGHFKLAPKGVQGAYHHSEFLIAKESGLIDDTNVQSFKDDFGAELKKVF